MKQDFRSCCLKAKTFEGGRAQIKSVKVYLFGLLGGFRFLRKIGKAENCFAKELKAEDRKVVASFLCDYLTFQRGFFIFI